jgi:hypothetical protein
MPFIRDVFMVFGKFSFSGNQEKGEGAVFYISVNSTGIFFTK